MRMRIEHERTPVGQESLAIKTGAGGLIDAEFLAQTLGMKFGWHEPNTLRALELGRAHRVWPKARAEKLIQHYQALRRIEGILRRWSFEGETVLPNEPAPLGRVAVRAGFATGAELLAAVAGHRSAIRAAYESVLRANQVERASSKTSRTLRAKAATE